MPSHTPVASAGSRGGHPLLFPGVALSPPGGWCPRLCTRQVSFSAHERDLEGRGIYGACLVWAPHTLLLVGNNSRAVKVGTWAAGCSTSMQQEVHTHGRQERRGKRENISSHQKSSPQGSNPLMSLSLVPRRREDHLGWREKSLCTQPATHFFLRILGFFTGRR